MKCLVQTARNIRHSVFDGVVHPEIEAVLTLADKHAEYLGGRIVLAEKCEMVRFSVGPEAARQIAKHFEAWADEAEKQAELLSVSAELRSEMEKTQKEGGGNNE